MSGTVPRQDIKVFHIISPTAVGFAMSTTIDIRRKQPEKAESPILVTLLGMVTEVKEQ